MMSLSPLDLGTIDPLGIMNPGKLYPDEAAKSKPPHVGL